MTRTRMDEKTRKLTAQISLGLMAGMTGMFAYAPVGFAMPTQMPGATFDAPKPESVTPINPTNDPNKYTKAINIVGSNTDKGNVLNWIDFSVASNEQVQFDGGTKTKDYLNIVNGAATSQIDGSVIGGKNVYLINPNGVIFGEGSSVNVGSLYVSTRPLEDLDTTAFQAGGSPLKTIDTNTYAPSDIVNMGKISATSVTVEGHNIRFENAAKILDSSGKNALTGNAVNLTALPDGLGTAGEIHIGHDISAKGEDGNSDYANAGTISNSYNTSGITIDYMLVNGQKDLQNINKKLDGNYMLAGDINYDSNVGFTSIGDNIYFSGKFDGNFHTLNNFVISANNGRNGLFSYTYGAKIENLGMINATIGSSSDKASKAGAIVGHALGGTKLNNVYVTETKQGGTHVYGNGSNTGGLVGYVAGSSSTTINSSYFRGNSSGGGIVGYINGSSSYKNNNLLSLSNVYSYLDSPSEKGFISGLNAKGDIYSNIRNSYTNATKGSTSLHLSGTYGSSYAVFDETGKTIKLYSNNDDNVAAVHAYEKKSYDDTNWSISNTGGLQKTTGGKYYRPTWRIYEGQSLPLLTAFFKGTVQADYTVNMNEVDASSYHNTDNIGTEKTLKDYSTHGFGYDRNGNVTAVYNGETPTISEESKVKFYGANYDTSSNLISDKYSDGNLPSKNAGTYYIFSSTQQGYDVAGDAFTITPKGITLSTNDTTINAEKEYDGTNTFTASNLFTGVNGIVDADKDILKVKADGTGYYYKSKADYEAYIAKGNNATDDDLVNATGTAAGNQYYVAISLTGSGTLDKANDSVTKSQYDAAAQNYVIDTTSLSGKSFFDETGVINPKKIYVNANSVDKTYDGTSNVRDAYITSLQNEITKNITSALDEVQTASNSTEKEKVELDSSSSISGAYYKDGNTVSDAGEDYTVKLTNLKLTGDNANNYQLVDSKGNTIYYKSNDENNFDSSKDVESGELETTGNIKRRYIDPSEIIAISKTYDGTSDVTADATVAIDTTKTIADGTESDEGLLVSDKDKFSLALDTNQSGVFYKDEGGTTEASDATESGLGNAAHYASAYVKATGDAVKNYTFDKTNLTKISSTDSTEVKGASGTINKRDLKISAKDNATVKNKLYDSTADVTDDVNNYVNITTGVTNNDGVTLTLGGKYLNTNNEGAANVYLVNGEEADKNIKFDATLSSSDDVANYTINGNTVTKDTAQNISGNAFDAKGKIIRRDVAVNFDGVTKEYDTTADVVETAASAITPSIVGADSDATINTKTIELLKSDGITDASGNATSKSNITGTYDDANVGTDKTVTYDISNSNLLNGSNNYKITKVNTGKGEIKKIVLGDEDDFKFETYKATKTYDGTASLKSYDSTSEKDSTKAVTDLADYIKGITIKSNGKDITLTNGKGVAYYTVSEDSAYEGTDAGTTGVKYKITFDDDIVKNMDISALNNKTVNGGTLAVDGASITKTTTDGTINKRHINVALDDYEAKTKVYDGTQAVADAARAGITYASSVDVTKSADGVIGDDKDIIVGIDSVYYKDKNANATPNQTYDNTNTITYKVSIQGDTNNNYALYVATDKDAQEKNQYAEYDSTNGITTGGNILKRTLNVTLNDNALLNYGGGINKVYDGTTSLGVDKDGNDWKDTSANSPLANYITLNTASTGDDTGVISGETVTLDYDQIKGTYGELSNGGKSITGNRNAGNHDVQLRGFALTDNGTVDDNYYISNDYLNTKGTITKKTLTGKVSSTYSKTYDGNTGAGNGSIKDFEMTFDGLLNVDNGKVKADTSKVEFDRYDDANVINQLVGENHGTKNHTVYYKNIGVTSDDGTADNYEFTAESTTGTGTITPKGINAVVKDGTKLTKVYDGSALTITAGELSLNEDDIVDKDKGNLTMTGSDISVGPDAGTYDLNLKGFTLGTTDANENYIADNYTLTSPAPQKATIAQRELIAKWKDGAPQTNIDKVYDSTIYSTGKAINNVVDFEDADDTKHTGLVANDDAELTYADGLNANTWAQYGTVNDDTFETTKNASDGDNSLTVRYAFKIGNANYKLNTDHLDGTGKITPKEISGSIGTFNTKNDTTGEITAVDGLSKIYDGTVALSEDNKNVISSKSLKAIGLYDGDNVWITADGGTYDSANATDNSGATKITYSNVKLAGNDAGNYTLTSTEGAGTITKKTITAKSVIGALGDKVTLADGTYTKTYDGKVLGISTDNISLDGVVDADEDDANKLSVTGSVENTSEKNAKEYKNVLSYDNVTLGGTSAKNYELDKKGLAKNITINKAPLTIEIGVAARDYRQNDTTVDSNGFGSVNVSGTVNGETIIFGDEAMKALSGQYGTLEGNNFTANGDVNVDTSNGTADYYTSDTNKGYGFKAIKYTGFSNALAKAEVTGTGASVDNYTIAAVKNASDQTGFTTYGNDKTLMPENTSMVDTVYFNEAAHQGYIRPLAITAQAIKTEWKSGDITKAYDGTEAAAGDKLRVYAVDTNDNTKVLADNLGYTYDSAKYNTKNVGADKVTYSNVKVTPESLGDNYDFAGVNIGDKTITNSDAQKVAITPRTVNVTISDNYEKTYDGSTDVKHLSSDYFKSDDFAKVSDGTGTINNVATNPTLTYAAEYVSKDAMYDKNGKLRDGKSADNNSVKYTVTLSGDDASNFDIKVNGTSQKFANNSYEGTAVGKIKQRPVYVDFKDGKGIDIDKKYDGNANVGDDYVSDKMVELVNGNGKDGDDTGIIGDGVTLNTGKARYDDENVKREADGSVKDNAKEVYYYDMGLENDDGGNYVLVAKDGKTETIGGTKYDNVLVGTGKITPAMINVEQLNAPTKEYDGTKDVSGTFTKDGTAYDYDSAANIKAEAITSSLVDQGRVESTTNADGSLKLTYYDANNNEVASTNLRMGDDPSTTANESAQYADKNAGDGIGITYYLRWDNANFELVHENGKTSDKKSYEPSTSKLLMELSGEGSITPRSIKIDGADGTVSKVYDGTTAAKGAEATLKYARPDGLTDDAVIAGDSVTFKVLSGEYDGKDAFDANGQQIEHKVNFTYDKGSISNKNYQLVEADADGNITKVTSGTGTVTGAKGTIERAPLYVTVDDQRITEGEAAPQSSTGSVTGFVNGESLKTADGANAADMRYDISKNSFDTSKAHRYEDAYGASVVGNDGKATTFKEGDSFGLNYYFAGYKMGALDVIAKTPVNPDDPHHPVNPDRPVRPSDIIKDITNKDIPEHEIDRYEESVRDATRFLPDDRSYFRASYDEDEAHYGRKPVIDLIAHNGGVNLGDEATLDYDGSIGVEADAPTLVGGSVSVDGDRLSIASSNVTFADEDSALSTLSNGLMTNEAEAVAREAANAASEANMSESANATPRVRMGRYMTSTVAEPESTQASSSAVEALPTASVSETEPVTMSAVSEATEPSETMSMTQIMSRESAGVYDAESGSYDTYAGEGDASEPETWTARYEREQAAATGITINSKDDEEDEESRLDDAALVASNIGNIGIETKGMGVNLSALG